MEDAAPPSSRFDTTAYWEARYRDGGNSGAGSHGRLAKLKARFLARFFKTNSITSQIDFGIDDGYQLSLVKPLRYIGVDVARTIVERMSKEHAGNPARLFLHVDDLEGVDRCEVGTSFDVIQHLVNDDDFEIYMRRLFIYSRRFVVIYSSNSTYKSKSSHILHRNFTAFISDYRPDWRLINYTANPYPFDPQSKRSTSLADFYIYAAPNEVWQI